MRNPETPPAHPSVVTPYGRESSPLRLPRLRFDRHELAGSVGDLGTDLPLIVGMLVRYFVPGFAERIGEGLIKISTVLLAIAVLPILVTNAPSVWSMIGSGVIVVLVLFTSVGLVAGHLLGGPNPDDRTVLALATCTRHPGVALAIAGLNFPEHKPTVMVIVLCHLIIGVVATVLYKAWRKRGQAARPAATRP